MDQNFSLMAQSRANYYTAGSPVQFVRVELLKGDTTGEVAVCLTFKNVGTEPLTGLVVHFKCKDAAGQVLCEDDFYYEQLNAQPGAVFGSDDAVYVSDTPVSSVEVEQDRAFLNGRGVDLRNYKRVRLNMPRVLPGSIAKTLQQRTGNVQLTCVPQDTEYGWFCACGAFHPNEENTTVCSECGGDRAGIKATLTAILEEARQAAERQQQEVNAVASSVAPAPAPAPQPQELKPFGFLAVCAGDGLAAVFADLGADGIVNGGQTMNPSTESILTEVERIAAETVFVLPNNKNIVMAAQQCAGLSEKKVIVIPTATVPQGISAMMAVDPDETDAAAIEQAMNAAASAVTTAQITYAARNSEFDGFAIREGDYLALLEGKLFDTDTSIGAVLEKLAAEADSRGAEFVNLFYGSDVSEEDAQKAGEQFGRLCPGAEINVVSGGQPVYYYIISME